MREGSWSASNETGPDGGTLLATRSGYRGQPRCVVLATRISACLSFSFSFPLCLDEYSDRRAQPVFTRVNITYEPRQWTPVTLLYSSVRILLNSFVLRDSIHVGIVCDYHAYLTSTNYPLSLRTKWIFLFDFVSCCYWKDECTVFFFILFYFIFLRFIFSNIFGDIFRSKDRRLIESCRRTWKALWIGGILCRFVNGSLSRREKRTPSTNPDTIAWLSCITLLHRCRFRRPFI